MSDAATMLAAALADLVREQTTAQAERLVDLTTGITPALLPRRAAATYLGVSGSQIDRLWTDGELEAVHDVGKGRLYTRESLDRLIDRRKADVNGHMRAEIRRLA